MFILGSYLNSAIPRGNGFPFKRARSVNQCGSTVIKNPIVLYKSFKSTEDINRVHRKPALNRSEYLLAQNFLLSSGWIAPVSSPVQHSYQLIRLVNKQTPHMSRWKNGKAKSRMCVVKVFFFTKPRDASYDTKSVKLFECAV